MNDVMKLRTYADIRGLAPAGFNRAMTFISWHNRLSMTPMLEPWEALVLSLASEQRVIDGMLYSAVKAFLEETRQNPVINLDQAKERARLLVERIS